MKRQKDQQIRHLAFQIIAQLPEDTTEAVRVLDYAKLVLIEAPGVAVEGPIQLRVVSGAD